LELAPSPPTILPAATCHTESRNAKRAVTQVAILAVLAGRGLGVEPIPTTQAKTRSSFSSCSHGINCDVSDSYYRYHGSQAVVISALQVAKHPIAAPGPSSVFTPPAFRHATLPGLCNSIFYLFTFREVLSRRSYQFNFTLSAQSFLYVLCRLLQGTLDRFRPMIYKNIINSLSFFDERLFIGSQSFREQRSFAESFIHLSCNTGRGGGGR
jgi:hypothetical protein